MCACVCVCVCEDDIVVGRIDEKLVVRKEVDRAALCLFLDF
jgi:hypothetical protein